jgi:hydrogenase-1 operon protein HyaF
MSALSDISVHVAAADVVPEDWGNSLPILHEVRHGLKRLAETGESTLIDLRAIPFGPGDEARLLDLLGEGEVTAEVDVLGPTRVWETAVKGVWIVDHRDLDEQSLALNIEVATIPDILRTQPEDVEDAIRALEERLAAASGEPAPESQARK